MLFSLMQRCGCLFIYRRKSPFLFAPRLAPFRTTTCGCLFGSRVGVFFHSIRDGGPPRSHDTFFVSFSRPFRRLTCRVRISVRSRVLSTDGEFCLFSLPPGSPKAWFRVVRPNFGVVRTYAFLLSLRGYAGQCDPRHSAAADRRVLSISPLGRQATQPGWMKFSHVEDVL
jgi:hypothetical protein